MEKARLPDKDSPIVYLILREGRLHERLGSLPLTGLALMMFIGLFAFGGQLLGWSDSGGQIQLGLFMSFLFGIICGYRTRS